MYMYIYIPHPPILFPLTHSLSAGSFDVGSLEYGEVHVASSLSIALHSVAWSSQSLRFVLGQRIANATEVARTASLTHALPHSLTA